jgi:DNA polymerase V
MKLQRIHLTGTIDFYSASTDSVMELPYADMGVSAGFPSPAQDFMDMTIDLNKELIKNPSATFYGRVKGESMKDVGIGDGDLLIIDRSIEPTNGRIAVCFINGEFTVKTIKIDKGEVWLVAANENYLPIKVKEENELVVWGVVIHVIKSF